MSKIILKIKFLPMKRSMKLRKKRPAAPVGQPQSLPGSNTRCVMAGNRVEIDPFTPMAASTGTGGNVWLWGSDNMLPYALAFVARESATHRRIINDKADYISGRGFSYDEGNRLLGHLVGCANGRRESLRSVLNKVAFDKCLLGNAFLEVVTNAKRSFVSFYHQDATRCRVGKDDRSVWLHHNWSVFTPATAKRLPLYPAFEPQEDGTLRSIIHYKDYEPMFEHYGVPPYIAGLGVSAIAWKTDRWNIARLDNSFQLSGVMVLDGDVDSEREAAQIAEQAEKQFAGKPGQVMFLIKNRMENEGSKFIPISSDNEGDWKALHEQATGDIVVAHSWFRALSGLDYSTGFNPERILHEYQVALNTIIQGEQAELLEPIRETIAGVFGIETDSLAVINRPPVQVKPAYMKVWEARKADGLDYDETDPAQQVFLAAISRTEKGGDR